jgi:hypothetical protein
MTEEEILGQIVQMLEVNSVHVDRIVERIPWGRRTSTPGIPDLLCRFRTYDRGTVVFFIEVKRPGAHRRPAQVDWIRQANEDGVIAFFAEGWPDVVSELSSHGITIRVK